MKPVEDKQTSVPFFQKVNRDQLLTAGDLQDFKVQILFEIKQMIKELIGKPTKQWLKSNEVRKLLGISPGTLQIMRNNGTIPFTKIGGLVYYNASDIQKMLEEQKKL